MVRSEWTVVGMLCLSGCVSDDGAADRTAYRRALSASLAEAIEACSSIDNAGLRGECMGGAATAAAQSGDRSLAEAACARVDEGLWRDECGFSVVDALELRGAEAWSACALAGQYTDHCVGHVLTAEVARMDDLPLNVGQEDALFTEVRDRVRSAGAPLNRRHVETVVFTSTARHIANRSAEGTFTLESCGVAPAPLCVRAYSETMRLGMDRLDRDRICAGPLSSELVASAGGTPWSPSAEGIAGQAWEALCVAWKGQGAGQGRGGPPPRRKGGQPRR